MLGVCVLMLVVQTLGVVVGVGRVGAVFRFWGRGCFAGVVFGVNVVSGVGDIVAYFLFVSLSMVFLVVGVMGAQAVRAGAAQRRTLLAAAEA